jgi:hypothetical protein
MPKIIRAAWGAGTCSVKSPVAWPRGDHRGQDARSSSPKRCGEYSRMNLVDCRSSMVKHLGGGRLGGDQREVRLDERAQLGARAHGAGHRVGQELDHPLHPRLEQADQQIVLVLEVEVDRAVGDARLLGDVGHLRGVEAALREHPLGGVEDALALGGAIGVGAGATGPSLR